MTFLCPSLAASSPFVRCPPTLSLSVITDASLACLLLLVLPRFRKHRSHRANVQGAAIVQYLYYWQHQILHWRVLPPWGIMPVAIHNHLLKSVKKGMRGKALHRYALLTFYTRSTYAPVDVFTRMRSSVVTNNGTCTTSPVSVVAGLVPPVAVSPL